MDAMTGPVSSLTSRSRVASWVLIFAVTGLLLFAPHAQADEFAAGFLPTTIRETLAIPDQIVPAAGASSSSGSHLLNLLDYLKSHVTHQTIDQLNQAHDGYNRRDDFGGWIVADSAAGCQDTRAAVLVRAEDASTPITFKDSRNCLVVKGLWHDPYAGQDYKLAKAMQIDHVVPLKHVYVTGGDQWPAAKRCYYANFLHNDFHLLAVSGHENMSKGDKSPDQYLPPNDSFQCEYVSSWMKVKAIWGLVATDAEIATIEQVIQEHHCADSKIEVPDSLIEAEQSAIDSSVPTRCQEFGTPASSTTTSF